MYNNSCLATFTTLLSACKRSGTCHSEGFKKNLLRDNWLILHGFQFIVSEVSSSQTQRLFYREQYRFGLQRAFHQNRKVATYYIEIVDCFLLKYIIKVAHWVESLVVILF